MSWVRYTNADGQMVAMSRVGARRYVDADALGSTVALWDVFGNKTHLYSYWSYGGIRSESNPVQYGSTFWNKYKFVGSLGCRTQADGGVYMRARTFTPHLGRFLTRVREFELIDGEHPFGYALDNPSTYADPAGLYTKKPGPCGATVVTLEPGDRVGVVVGPGGTMISGSGAINAFRKPGEDCIAVNGGFFGTPPYRPGKPAYPIDDVTDFGGGRYPDPRCAKGRPYKFPKLPVIAPGGGGSIAGRPPTSPGGANPGNVPRTGACTDKNGNLISLVVIPNVDFGKFKDCMQKICPKGSTIVLLDGGSSSQIVSPGKSGGRPLHNWFVICE